MNLAGVLVSYAFIFLVIIVASLLSKNKIISSSLSRKVIHIGVSFWWIIASLMIDSLGWALIGPISFIIINFLIARLNLLPDMNSGNGRNYGTVYFPVSLVILVIAVYRFGINYAAAGCGILVLGWGDGMASIIGEKTGFGPVKIFGNRKTLAGSTAMFVSSLAVLLVYSHFTGLDLNTAFCVFTALIAAAIEFITPFGLDNISIPIIVTLFIEKLAV